MRINKIKKYDIANGPGCRVSLFVQGCHMKCPGCFNEETWDPKGGEEIDILNDKEFWDMIADPHIKGLSILGGEPFLQLKDVLEICKKLKTDYPGKDIWLWTGFPYDWLELVDLGGKYCVLDHIDYIVDNPFVESEKDISLIWRGSKNQRIIDVATGNILTEDEIKEIAEARKGMKAC